MVKKLEEVFNLEYQPSKLIEEMVKKNPNEIIIISSGCVACNSGGGCNRGSYSEKDIEYNE